MIKIGQVFNQRRLQFEKQKLMHSFSLFALNYFQIQLKVLRFIEFISL
jgi:hypothetical protein